MESKNPLLKGVTLFGNKKKVATLLLLMLTLSASAQTDRLYVRQGNKQFRAGDYANAEVSYRKALEKNDRNPQALYNLGNALMAQRKDSAAVVEFEKAAKAETTPLRQSKSYHNMGVICQQHQMYGEAIEAYKQSLRLNPADDETRYNLQLCKHMQKQQQQQQQQQQNQNKNDKQNKDQQKQDQQKQQNEKQDQQKQDQQPPKMSKDNAEQLLNAAMQQEKQTQDRMKKAMQQPQRRQLNKNW
jgi:Ca-activated chloride channel family protein